MLAPIAALVAACAKDTTGPSATTPVTASVAVTPAPGATGVSRSAAVMVVFSTAVDSASCLGRFSVHMGDSLGMVVPGRMTWDSTYHRMTFTPDSMLQLSTTYLAYMRDSVMTLGGMMGGDMGGMSGGSQQGPGSPMMFTQPPAGATATASGMLWTFATGP